MSIVPTAHGTHRATNSSSDHRSVSTPDRDDFADKVFQAVLGAQLVQTAYLGYKLGWYQALARSSDGMTPPELAAATQSSSRYAREWLEQQTVAGWLHCHNPEDENAEERRFSLPAAHGPVLTDPLALDYMMPLAVIQAAWGQNVDRLVTAYQQDTGVGWEDMPSEVRDQQAASNRPFFLQKLPQLLEDYVLDPVTVSRWKSSDGRIADLGIGYGWSSIGVAQHFSAVRVDGYDLDAVSVEVAGTNIQEAGLSDRVVAHCHDAATVIQDETFEPYDLVMALECIHDLNNPIAVLRTMRFLSGEHGTVLVMDERVAESFSEALHNKHNNPVEQAMYGFSCLCCLADGKSRTPSTETGTVMRPQLLRMYAQQAGFRNIEILRAEHDFFRFYKLLK